MDYPKSVPNVGLVGGKFVDENTGTGQVGSLIPATWGTAVTDEIINVIKDAGLLPKEAENNQLSAAIKEIIKGKANLESPVFTGAPLAPTAAAGTNTKQLATTAFVWSAVNTYATTVTASLALKADAATSLRVGSVSRQRPVLSGTVAAGADGGSDGTGGAIEIREVNEVAAAQSSLLYAPGILFNWSNRFARYLKMSAVGDLMWGDKKLLNEGNITDMLATVAMQPNGRVMIPTKDGTPLYLQWYEGPLAGAETVAYPAVSHPVPFPNQCLFAGVFTRSTTDNNQSDQMFQMVTWDRLGVKVFPQWFGTGTQSLVKPLIFAIGN